MQQAAFELKNELWNKLKVIYERYTNPRTQEIETERV